MRKLSSLEQRSRPFWIATAVLLIALVAVIDILTGPEVSFALFYLAPIVLVTWFTGRPLGVATSVLSAIAWSIADAVSGTTYSHPLIRYWNTGTRLAFFLMATFFLPLLQALEREKELARRDSLTGAANRLSFVESVQGELVRSRRYDRPFTIVFADIDNFKAVNDRFGHAAGDQLLRAVVSRAKGNLRQSDLVARIGGDEFAFLMPETSPEAAKRAVTKLQSALLDEMRQRDLPVTFSIGALTCLAVPGTIDDLMKRVDELMYAAKKQGKNQAAFDVYAGLPGYAGDSPPT
jgi:diguanylate cyclase (GGDEF)-like protein